VGKRILVTLALAVLFIINPLKVLGYTDAEIETYCENSEIVKHGEWTLEQCIKVMERMDFFEDQEISAAEREGLEEGRFDFLRGLKYGSSEYGDPDGFVGKHQDVYKKAYDIGWNKAKVDKESENADKIANTTEKEEETTAPKEEAEERSNSDNNLFLTLGVLLGILVILLIGILVALIVIIMKRKHE
jgi:hypothetical protein